MFPKGAFQEHAAERLILLALWDAKTWKKVATLRGFVLATHSVAFSANGKRLATGGGAGVLSEIGILHVWRAPSWAEIQAAEAQDKAASL
ncbi:MAG: hypothetical protein ACREE6_04690 [Limisphaerales bacterium]